jgi:hypothetical protein
MEIRITTNQVLKVLQVLSWIIFIGLCIETGSIIIGTFINLFIKPLHTENYWGGSDYLSSLYKYGIEHFVVVTVIMIIVGVLKTIMFYLIVKLFTDKKLKISQPFSEGLRRFVVNEAYLVLGIGLFSYYGIKYTQGLTQKGFVRADLQSLHFAGADVWLFMAVILMVIIQVIKRGIDLQNENSLTI